MRIVKNPNEYTGFKMQTELLDEANSDPNEWFWKTIGKVGISA